MNPKTIIPVAGALLLALNSPIAMTAAGHDHEAEAAHQEPEIGHGDEEENVVTLSAAQMKAAGIKVLPLRATAVAAEVMAPGEVMLNAYATSQVTPRIQAQVIERKARLGDHVVKGLPLVILSSVEVAEAQGQLVVAAREWQRVKELGRKVVSEQRYIEARVAYGQARSRLLAYGLLEVDVDKLVARGGDAGADGVFALAAPQAGTVTSDAFITGQMVESGVVLFVITDESHLWVEAKVNPLQATHVSVGTPARVNSGDVWLDGKVIQVHHQLDESTRTLGVRIAVPNPGDRLHPGQFVDARIQLDGADEKHLTLPSGAVLRSPDGDWQVFIEEAPGKFEPKEIEVVRRLPGRLVIGGLEPGTRVVTAGAFFVQSELAKAGFSVHNH
jgi:RND family efflux transporter MFP subunit